MKIDLEFKAQQEEARDRFPSPSSIGECTRQLAYRWHQTAEAMHPALEPITSKITLSIGTHVHQLLSEQIVGLVSVGKRVTVNLTNGTLVIGEIDGLLAFEHDGQEVLGLVEIKTMNPIAFERFKTHLEIDRKYEVQANLYAHMLREHRGIDVDCILFVGVNKAKTEIVARAWDLKPDMTVAALHRANEATSSIVPEATPRAYEPTNGKLPWQCAYCPFWQPCWPEAVANPDRVELRIGGA
jgi:hypothetical protein